MRQRADGKRHTALATPAGLGLLLASSEAPQKAYYGPSSRAPSVPVPSPARVQAGATRLSRAPGPGHLFHGEPLALTALQGQRCRQVPRWRWEPRSGRGRPGTRSDCATCQYTSVSQSESAGAIFQWARATEVATAVDMTGAVLTDAGIVTLDWLRGLAEELERLEPESSLAEKSNPLDTLGPSRLQVSALSSECAASERPASPDDAKVKTFQYRHRRAQPSVEKLLRAGYNRTNSETNLQRAVE